MGKFKMRGITFSSLTSTWCLHRTQCLDSEEGALFVTAAEELSQRFMEQDRPPAFTVKFKP
jgi:hypothetical protein